MKKFSGVVFVLLAVLSAVTGSAQAKVSSRQTSKKPDPVLHYDGPSLVSGRRVLAVAPGHLRSGSAAKTKSKPRPAASTPAPASPKTRRATTSTKKKTTSRPRQATSAPVLIDDLTSFRTHCTDGVAVYDQATGRWTGVLTQRAHFENVEVYSPKLGKFITGGNVLAGTTVWVRFLSRPAEVIGWQYRTYESLKESHPRHVWRDDEYVLEFNTTADIVVTEQMQAWLMTAAGWVSVPSGQVLPQGTLARVRFRQRAQLPLVPVIVDPDPPTLQQVLLGELPVPVSSGAHVILKARLDADKVSVILSLDAIVATLTRGVSTDVLTQARETGNYEPVLEHVAHFVPRRLADLFMIANLRAGIRRGFIRVSYHRVPVYLLRLRFDWVVPARLEVRNNTGLKARPGTRLLAGQLVRVSFPEDYPAGYNRPRPVPQKPPASLPKIPYARQLAVIAVVIGGLLCWRGWEYYKYKYKLS